MRRFLFIILFASTACHVVPARADSLLSTLFPSVFGAPETGPKPEETLIAPFAQNANASRNVTPTEAQTLQSPENKVPVTQAHRNDAFIISWAQEQAAAALMFDPSDTAAHMAKMDAVMLPAAKDDVQKYLTDSGLLAKMVAQKDKLQSFTRDVPLMMNEGNFGGVYRWLVDVPVVVSLLPQGMQNYRGKNADPNPETHEMTVRLQIGRILPVAANGVQKYPDSIVIERFTVMPGS